ncbi:5251_t:CDS:2, partial [Entrophospora sp. SA101]
MRRIISKIGRHLYHLNAFLQSKCNSSDFGFEIDLTIISHNFNPSDFYPNFHVAFEAALNKFNAHIPSHPACPLFILL